MATFNAPSLQDTVYSGDCPLAVAHGYATLAAAANDKVRLLKLFAGTKIFSLDTVFADLGTNTGLDIGFEYANGESGSDSTAFAEAIDADPAGTTRHTFKPVTLAYDAYIIATVTTAAAAGDLDVMLTYEFKGK